MASASGVDYPVTPFSVPDAAVPHVLIDNERSEPLIHSILACKVGGYRMPESEVFIFCLLVSISFRESLDV